MPEFYCAMAGRLAYLAALFMLMVGSLACSADGPTPGLRGACASAGGAGLACDTRPIESAHDACWKLVDCGVIPIANPDDNPDCCLDWGYCVAEIEGLDDYNTNLALACVEIASCDELKTDRSPEGPGRNDEGLPLCLQHGNF